MEKIQNILRSIEETDKQIKDVEALIEYTEEPTEQPTIVIGQHPVEGNVEVLLSVDSSETRFNICEVLRTRLEVLQERKEDYKERLDQEVDAYLSE